MSVPPAVVARLASLTRYAAVSVVSTVVGLTTLALLVTAGWPAGWANVVATAIGTIPSFELNRRWVWGRRGQPSVSRQILPFVILCALELLVSTGAVHLVAVWASGSGVHGFPRTLAILAANVAAYGGCWVGQYLFLDRILFVEAS